MKISNLIVWLLGIGLIVFLCVLVSDFFVDKRVLYLDGFVLIFTYSLGLFVYGGLFVSKEEFVNEVPATGVKMFTLGIYSTLAIIWILVGFRFEVPFKWQLFIHLCLVATVIVGMLLADASVKRLAKVADESRRKHAYVDNLSASVQQIQLAASLNSSLDPTLKIEISKFVERVNYISPSNSSTAKLLEATLTNSVTSLLALINSGEANEKISCELEKANTILSQRIKTY